MARRKAKESSNTQIPVRRATSYLNQVGVRRNNALRTIRRVALSTQTGRGIFGPGEGFNNVVIGNPAREESLVGVERIGSLQNALILDRIANGELDKVPALEEMFELDKDNNKRITAIGQHLDDCCEAIKELLRRLRELVRNEFRDLKKYIFRGFKTIADLIQESKRDFYAFYSREKSAFINGINTVKQEILREIREIVRQELEPVKGSINELSRKVDRRCTTIDTEVAKANGVLEKVEPYMEETLPLINGIAGVLELFLANYYEVTQPIIVATGVEVTGIGEFIGTHIFFNKKYLNKCLNSTANVINKHVDNDFKDFLEHFNREIEELPEKTGKETSLWVVGESYSKWDSVCSYFPSITFVFTEETSCNAPRKSQIKLRVNKPSSEWTDQDIEELRVKVLKNLNLSYNYGLTRGNYVSKDKRLKTTVFGSNETEVINILTKTFSVIEEIFDKDLLTITSGGKKRPSLTRRVIKLVDIDTNQANYNETFKVKLRRVTLMINGLNHPISLFP